MTDQQQGVTNIAGGAGGGGCAPVAAQMGGHLSAAAANPNPHLLQASPTVGAVGDNAFDDRLDPNATAISPLNPKWLDNKWSQGLILVCCILSFLSICLNTPKLLFTKFNKEGKSLTPEMLEKMGPGEVVFEPNLYVFWSLFTADLFLALLFSFETLSLFYHAIKRKSSLAEAGVSGAASKTIYPFWLLFDAMIAVFHWVSLAIQMMFLLQVFPPYYPIVILRLPRTLIILRPLRHYLSFRVTANKSVGFNSEDNKVSKVFRRSGKQVWNVTMFLLFFLSLYGLVGVQFFGVLNHHCVRKGANVSDIQLDDLMIPDTHCTPDLTSEFGYKCPEDLFECREIFLRWDQRDYNGFDNFIYSIFTVYESASQEGWILTMYKTLDTFELWKSYVYFFTLIFFLAWLVKNVFIAVVIETFAELRVQFQQICGTKNFGLGDAPTQRFAAAGPSSWEIVTVDENKRKGVAPEVCVRIVQSDAFHLTALMLVLADALFAASTHYTLVNQQRVAYYNQVLYYIQIVFTVLFDLEALFKIFCLGYWAYIERGLHKFEFLVAVGSTIRLVPDLYKSQLTYFQVLRVVRLIKMSPVTEEFVFKIFGPTKKLGTLIMFTMSTLILTSAVSLQLFCHIDDLKHFENFIQAFMAMFQILTQEGWVEVMDTTMWKSGEYFAPFVAVYFVFYHLFATLIVLCLFVAVILDNLELDEDVKRIKQLKAREHKAGTEDKLPWRLALFEKFPDTPQMVHVNKLSRNSDFPSEPKVRDSFMRNFVTSGSEFEVLVKLIEGANELLKPKLGEAWETPVETVERSDKLKKLLATEDKRDLTRLQPSYFMRRIRSLAALKDCNRYQSLNEPGSGSGSGLGLLYRGGTSMSGTNSLFATQHALRQDRRHRRSGSVKLGLKLDNTKENGHVSAFTPVKTRDLDIKILQEKTQQAEIKRSAKEENLRENHPLFDTPLFMVGRECRLRRFCQLIVTAQYNPIGRDRRTGLIKRSTYQPVFDLVALVPYLDWGMILVTIVSACSMMLETPFDRVMDHEELQITEYIFVTAMSLELTFKMLANGLFFTPNAVIKDFGGVLDMFIYLNGLVFLTWLPEEVPSHSFAQFLMVGRCLRPLRIFSLVPDMRRVVYELVRGFKEILLVSVLLVALIFIFASYGVQTLAGRLYKCNDVTIDNRKECTGNFHQTISVVKYLHIGTPEDLPAIWVPRVWDNPRNFNFDNIFTAMLCLFEVLTLKSWYEIRDVIMKETGEINGLFVHVFVFIGCLIGVTLFVGVIIANFQENNGRALLTVDQRRWEDLKRRLSLVQPLHLPPRPGDKYSFRQYVYDQIMSKRAKRFIAFLAVAQSSLLYSKWEEKNEHTIYLATLSALFNVLFAGEALMKCVAVSFRGYWQSFRNRYDLLVTVLGLLWSGLFVFQQKDKVYELGTLVVMLRFFTICGKQATLKMLLLTVLVSVYKSFFIILSLFVLILCYALSGVILFGTVKYGENLHRRANFHNAGQAMTVLFRIVTGEDWNKIMHDCMLSPPLCTEAPNYWESDCGSFTASIIFFCSFYVILAYIVLNLLVAIIVENFSLFYSNDADALLSYNDIKMFQEKWKIVDRERKGYITTIQVRFLLRHLTGRLQVDMVNDKLLFKHMCCEAEKMHNGVEVSFHEILSMLAYRSVDIRKVLQLEELLEREELEFSIEEEVAKQTIINWFNKIVKARNLKKQTTGETFISQLRHQIEEEVIQKITPNEPKPTASAVSAGDDGVEKMGQFLTASDGSKKYKKGMSLKKNVSSESESNASLVYIDSWKSYTCSGSATKVNNWWNSALLRNSSSAANRNGVFDSDDSGPDASDEEE